MYKQDRQNRLDEAYKKRRECLDKNHIPAAQVLGFIIALLESGVN